MGLEGSSGNRPVQKFHGTLNQGKKKQRTHGEGSLAQEGRRTYLDLRNTKIIETHVEWKEEFLLRSKSARRGRRELVIASREGGEHGRLQS